MLNVRGYIFSRSFFNERVPQHIQNLVIRSHAEKYNLTYLLSGVEHRMKNSYLMLNQIVEEVNLIDGVIMYSLFMLPKNFAERQLIINAFIDNGKEVHLAAEDLILKTSQQVENINNIFFIRDIMNTNVYKESLDDIIKFYSGNAY